MEISQKRDKKGSQQMEMCYLLDKNEGPYILEVAAQG